MVETYSYKASFFFINTKHRLYYDCVLAMAQAHTKLMADANITPANLAANNIPPLNIESFTRIKFTGLTGDVEFDANGDRIG